MASGRIVPQRKTGSSNTYYYFRNSYRVKEDPRDRASGKKGPGSGKSRVVTEDVYLGTAQEVLRKIREGSRATELETKSFGMECAALAVARELNLINIIDRHVDKRRQGLSIGEYLVVAAINRICKPTSRNGIAGWFKKSVLPEKMEIDPRLLKSKNFWNAWDKMISENQVKERRKAAKDGRLEEGVPVLDDSVILDIEHDIWEHLLTLHDIQLDPILYDTTNFYTYLDPTTKSDLAQYAKSKDEKNGCRCVGLAIGLTSVDGLPAFHLVYAANRHDSKLFPEAMSTLTKRFAKILRSVEGVRLVIDKGNNSKKNIQAAAKEQRLVVVGSLVPSHNQDLMRKSIKKSYTHRYEGLPAYREEREVFGLPSVVVVTFNEKLKKKQNLKLKAKLANLEALVRETFEKHHRKESKTELQGRIAKVLGKSDVGQYLDVEVTGRRFKALRVERDKAKWRDKQAKLGKNIMFSTAQWMSVQEVVGLYRSRNGVEDAFKLEKDPDGVPFRPTHCRTDSKIRVYAFTCVLGLLIWRLMHYKLRRAGLAMSDRALKMELRDLREAVMMYGPARVERMVTKRSTLQEEIAGILGLSTYFPHA